MASDFRRERLSHLRAEVNRSVEAFLHRAILITPTSGALPETGRRRAASGGLPPMVARTNAEVAPGEVTVNVNLMGGTIFLDDERSVRALAKEIKRLITEDRRWGLGVGG